MKNTKFRRRALVSSVAMLLVALVALGSATFAWFSTTTTASASSFTAKTDKASNILLNEYKTDNTDFAHDWSQTLTLTQNTATSGTNGTSSMQPVTTKDFTNWYTVTADTYNVGYKQTPSTGALSNIKSSGSYAKYTTLYIQNTGVDTAATINTSVTYADNSNTAGIDYVRVALVPISSGTNGTTAAGSGNIIFGSNNDFANTTDGWTTADQTPSSSTTIVTGPLGTAQSLGTLVKDKIYGYDVYVYFEGTDKDCKDQFAGGNFTVTLNVAKSGS